jgi:hypothetical protein
MAQTISYDEAKENGCRNSVSVETGKFGNVMGDEHVIQVIISTWGGYASRELEWAALTLAEAECLRDDLDDAIREMRKKAKS